MKEIKTDWDQGVSIMLTKASALVLFEFLSYAEEAAQRKGRPSPDHAELKAFDELCGRLESTLVEPFAPNYRDIIAEAKKRLVK